MDLRRDALITADRTGKVLSQRKLSEITGGAGAIRLLAMADGKLLLVTAGCIYCLDETLSDIKAFKTTNQANPDVMVEIKEYECNLNSIDTMIDACNRLYAGVLAGNRDAISVEGTLSTTFVKCQKRNPCPVFGRIQISN